MSVVLETTIGEITVDLFLNERPRTCMNFIKLCKMKYYNFNLIFSIEHNFIAQSGDPTGTGRGGSCMYEMIHGENARFYEGEKIPILKHKNVGTLSMASCGGGMYGSQFFITLGSDLDSLDEEHLVFGQVVEGLEVLDHLNQVLIDETKRPYQDILVTHTVVLSDPYPEPEGLQYPCESPLPPESLFNSNYIAADEQLEKNDLENLVQMQEQIEAKEAEARATILEMVGDLPSADMAPPENVLFVCKLNPVTTSEDLEVIFSRFGKINSAEVIKDRITNNSLQYAFIEFADQKSCEAAYFKMDNVLIDDRRIHVDFSQSVSKVKWRGKGRGVDLFDERGRRVYDKEGTGKKFEGKRFNIDNSKASDPLYRMEPSSKRKKEEINKSDHRKNESHKASHRKEESHRREDRNDHRREDNHRKEDFPRTDHRRENDYRTDHRREDNHRTDHRKEDFHKSDKTDHRREDYRRTDHRREDNRRTDYSRNNKREDDYRTNIRREDFHRTDHRREDNRTTDHKRKDDQRTDHKIEDIHRTDHRREDNRTTDHKRKDNLRTDHRREDDQRTDHRREDIHRTGHKRASVPAYHTDRHQRMLSPPSKKSKRKVEQSSESESEEEELISKSRKERKKMMKKLKKQLKKKKDKHKSKKKKSKSRKKKKKKSSSSESESDDSSSSSESG